MTKMKRLIPILITFALGYYAGTIDGSIWRLAFLLVLLSLGFYRKLKGAYNGSKTHLRVNK